MQYCIQKVTINTKHPGKPNHHTGVHSDTTVTIHTVHYQSLYKFREVCVNIILHLRPAGAKHIKLQQMIKIDTATGKGLTSNDINSGRGEKVSDAGPQGLLKGVSSNHLIGVGDTKNEPVDN
jgi:hypothetical protein